MSGEKRKLRSGELAAKWGVSAAAVQMWAREDKIPSTQTLGGHYRFDPDIVLPGGSYRSQQFTTQIRMMKIECDDDRKYADLDLPDGSILVWIGDDWWIADADAFEEILVRAEES